jgi:hypothetical protein
MDITASAAVAGARARRYGSGLAAVDPLCSQAVTGSRGQLGGTSMR